jgi:hypothetical protein
VFECVCLQSGRERGGGLSSWLAVAAAWAPSPSVTGCMCAHASADCRAAVSLMPAFWKLATARVTGGSGRGALPWR